MESVRFGRELDGGNQRPLISFYGACMAFSLFQRRPRQASGSPTESFRHLTPTCMWAMVSIGRMVFSSLNTPSPFLFENNSPI